jgi:streptogramin lyase
MLNQLFKIFNLATFVAFLSLTSLKAQAALFVSSVANTNPGTVVNYDPITGTFTDNFTPGNSSILEYDEQTGAFIGTFVPKGAIGLSSGIVFGPDGNLYANDQGNDKILRFNGKTGDFIDIFADTQPTGLHRPEDLLFGADGNLYVSGLAGGGVQRFDGKTGNFLGVVANTNSAGQNLIAAGLNFSPDGNNLYISSVLNDNSILRYNLQTNTLDTFIPPSIAQPVPSGTVVSPDGQYLYNGTFLGPATIKQYDTQTGALLGDFVTASNNGGLQTSSRLRFGPDGNLYVSDFAGNSIMRYNGQTGAPIDAFVSPGSGGLLNPGGFAFFTAVPEPSAYLGVLGFGAYLGASSVIKRKQKQQKSINLNTNTSNII